MNIQIFDFDGVICDSNNISIELAIDTCAESLYSPIWQFDNNALIDSLTETLIEITFADYGNNVVQYTAENYCGSADSVYVHSTIEPVPEIISPDLTFCIESDYTLELENDSLNGSCSLRYQSLVILFGFESPVSVIQLFKTPFSNII